MDAYNRTPRSSFSTAKADDIPEKVSKCEVIPGRPHRKPVYSSSDLHIYGVIHAAGYKRLSE